MPAAARLVEARSRCAVAYTGLRASSRRTCPGSDGPGRLTEKIARRSCPMAGAGCRRASLRLGLPGIMARWLVAVAAFVILGAAEAEEIAVPFGFRIDRFAGGIAGARGLAIDPAGVLLVSVPVAGRVLALPDRDGTGQGERRRSRSSRASTSRTAWHSGAAISTSPRRAGSCAIGTTRQRSRRFSPRSWSAGCRTAPTTGAGRSPSAPTGSSMSRSARRATLPERDLRRAAIVRYDADGAREQRFATGLRNPVGLAFHPSTGALWTTVNERDWPGSGAPPDYVTDVRRGATYGWPRCYAQRGAFLPDPRVAATGRCDGLAVPALELAPHSAPLGLAFYTGRQFPPEYRGSLFVALHGSRAELPAAGYSIARVRFRGGRATAIEPFSTGWRQGTASSAAPSSSPSAATAACSSPTTMAVASTGCATPRATRSIAVPEPTAARRHGWRFVSRVGRAARWCPR